MLDKLWILDLLKKSSSVPPNQMFSQTPVRTMAAKPCKSSGSPMLEPLLFAKYAHKLSAHSTQDQKMQKEVANEEKSPVNLRIRTSLKKRAKNLGVNLSQTLEKSLEAEIRRREQLEWVEANRQAIEAYNRRIDDLGPALAAYRSF